MYSFPSLERTLAFTEAHLREPICVADMAAAAGYSLFHFCRTFNAATHLTPYDYLIRRRLAQAAVDLVHTQRKIIDIALDYQFNNPETFSRAFRRVSGQAPNEFRRLMQLDPRRHLPPLSVAHLAHFASSDLRWPVHALDQTLSLIGLMTHLLPGANVPGWLWEHLEVELEAAGLQTQVLGLPRYGLRWYRPGWQNAGTLYMAGVERSGVDGLPGGGALVSKQLPVTDWAIFRHPGDASSLPLTQDWIDHIWQPPSGFTLAPSFILEIFEAGGIQVAAPLARIQGEVVRVPD